MLFKEKIRGFFVEISEHTVRMARTSAPVPPFTIEELREVPADDVAAIADALKAIRPRRMQGEYLSAIVGTYPPRRLVRKHTLELKRIREAGYLNEVFTQQFRIEPDKYTIAVMQASDGADYDLTKASQKEALFAGLANEDILAVQNNMLESKIYPERLEIGSIATLGAMTDYLAFTKSKTPSLLLEISNESTHSFIVSAAGVEASRPIPQGLDAMVPIVQKELGLKDEESARKLFFSNTFDFTGMGPALIRRLLKELQSSIGFYEVQTGQSVGQVMCAQLTPKLAWLEKTIADSLGVSILKPEPLEWLKSRQITVPDAHVKLVQEPRCFGLLGLMTSYNSANAAVPEEKK